MKKTSLRKNRFSVQLTRLPGNVSTQTPSAQRRVSSADAGSGTISLHDMMMDQWAFNDDDIAERLAASAGRPISPEVQAYYDRMFALTHGKAWENGEAPAALSDAA